MVVSQIVTARRLATAATIAAALWCGQARAQVLEQVPSDALAVLKIKALSKTNAKVAKLAKEWGLDEMSPEMKDPLGTVLDEVKMSKGLNKDGDAALAMYAPDKHKGKDNAETPANDEPIAVALVPVSDYDAFVGNFEKSDKAAAGEGVTAVKAPDSGETLYLVHRGNYAVMSNQLKHLDAKGGLKLTKIVQREADDKDAVFILNMPALRDMTLPEIKKHRKELIEQMDKALADQEQAKPFVPVFDTVVNLAIDKAVEFLDQADGIAASLDIQDKGIVAGGVVDFAADSEFGKTVAAMKPNTVPLLAGLPEGKYFFVGGMSIDSSSMSSVAATWIDPIAKSLKDTNNDTAKKISDLLEMAKTTMSSFNHSAAGMPVPTKPLGQESIVQEVGVVYGDAKAMVKSQKGLLTDMNELMALVPKNAGAAGGSAKFEMGETKTVDGVELQTYSTKLDFDKNDPQAAQVQQIMSLVYGGNGITGNFGAVDDKTFIMAQGASDELIKEVIASSKTGKDVLSDTAAFKTTASLFPADRSLVYYVCLDNVVTSALSYAAGFGFAVKLKLPDDLPPIGIAAGVEGSSFRVDTVIPTKTVQAMISAGLKAYTDMQGGKGGGL